MGSYRSLRVWERAHKLVLDVYTTTRSFPREEIYGLTSQMRRAAASIPANLAEGCGRESDKELARFARISLGSATELDYYVILSTDLGYVPEAQALQIAEELSDIRKMLSALAASLAEPRSSHRIARLKTED